MSDERMDGEKVTVTVRIAGEEHRVRSTAEPEYTRACARVVDERIREIRERSGLLEGHRAAILAALSITDHLLQAQQELDRLRREVTSRTTNLARRIQAELDEVPGGEVVEEGEGHPDP